MAESQLLRRIRVFSNSRKDQPFTPHSFHTRASFLPKFEPKKPKIIMSRQAFALMTLYVEIAQQEVGWMGTVKRLPNGDFYIEKCFLFKQQVHETETEITNEGFSELSMELLDGVVDEDESNWDVNKLRFWGHSHVRMATHPSMTDERTMLNDFGTGRSTNTGQARFCFEECGYPWVIRGIFNKYGEVNFTVYIYTEGMKYEDVEWTVEEPSAEQVAIFKAADERSRSAWKAQFAAKIRAEKEEERKRAASKASPSWSQMAAPSSAAETTTHFKKEVEVPKKDDGEEWFDLDAIERSAPEEKRSTFGGLFLRPAAPSIAERYRAELANFISQEREYRYRPDITPELREAVQAEFTKKVRSNSRSWFWGGSKSYGSSGSNSGSSGRSTVSGSDSGSDSSSDAAGRYYSVPDSSSAASGYSDDAPRRELLISEVEGEASGPGTTGGGSAFGVSSSPPRYTQPRSTYAPRGEHQQHAASCMCSSCQYRRDLSRRDTKIKPEDYGPTLSVRETLRSAWHGLCDAVDSLVNPPPKDDRRS